MREDTPIEKARRLKDSLRKRESRAREDSLTRLARQSQHAASTKESRAREDTPTRLARQSEDSERKKVKRSDPEQNLAHVVKPVRSIECWFVVKRMVWNKTPAKAS